MFLARGPIERRAGAIMKLNPFQVCIMLALSMLSAFAQPEHRIVLMIFIFASSGLAMMFGNWLRGYLARKATAKRAEAAAPKVPSCPKRSAAADQIIDLILAP